MANKQMSLYKGQTKTLQCKSVFEGKNAIEKTMTLNGEMDFKDITEPMGGELNPDGIHVDLFLKGIAVGTETIVIPFGYNGKESGVEGADISTVNVDVSVTDATVFLTPTENVFDYDSAGTYELVIDINDGTDSIVLNSEGIMLMDSQAMIDIVTVGPDRLMIKPNAGWTPDPGSITGKITLYYFDASVEVPFTFNVPEPRRLVATVEDGTIVNFAGGEKKLTIKDQNDTPVTDVTFVSVNVSTERNATGVYEFIGQYLRVVDAATGVYAFDYSALYTGAKVTLVFKVSSGGIEYDLNPVVVQFSQEPVTAVYNPTIIPKASRTASVDVTINMKRSKNGVAVPVTGTLSGPVGNGSTMTTTPALNVPYRIRTFKLTNINTTDALAYLNQMQFVSTEHNSGPISVLIQIPRVK